MCGLSLSLDDGDGEGVRSGLRGEREQGASARAEEKDASKASIGKGGPVSARSIARDELSEKLADSTAVD